MNFFKRAMLSIVRRPGKSVILLILIFILGNIIAGAISVQQAVANTEKSIRSQLGAAATLSLDYQNIDWEALGDQSPPSLTVAEMEAVAALPQVKYFDYSAMAGLSSKTLKRVESEDGGVVYGGMGTDTYFSLYGIEYAPMLAIESGQATLADGRVFTESEVKNGSQVVLISKQLAELNDLKVGDKITLDNNYYGDVKAVYDSTGEDTTAPKKVESYDLEVIGIFEPKIEVKAESKNGQMDFDYMNIEKQNMIYSPNKVAIKASEFQSENWNADYPDQAMPNTVFYQPVYILNDPAEGEAFRAEASALIPELYTVELSSDSYKAVAGPLETIQWIAGIILVVAIAASLIILSLLVTLFLRDRKHEIGVYLALGEKRLKVIGQIVIEVFSVALVAITLSLFSGNMIAQSISSTMLQNQMIAEQEQGGSYYGGNLEWLGYGSSVSSEEVADSYSVSLDPTTILLFYGVGSLTVVVSTLIPILYILRLNPRKIMM
ncbi:ABC transporter permease [Culicoidibacter larvae]|nr:ABC transporter permease [Culicoidibacter larvae]